MAKHHREGTVPPLPPAPNSVPRQYPVLLPGDARKLQTKLNWWDSFQTATGFSASATRFVISTAIVAGAIYITLPPQWLKWLREFRFPESFGI